MSLDSEGALDDVIWQPLTFEKRSRARIIVVDDNAVRVLSSVPMNSNVC
jgi:hypothetical protein